MVLESLLAYAHLIAIFSLIVFLTSEAALCRSEWMNAEAVRRLARVDFVYMLTAVAVLATGVARTAWGIKGIGWYWSQPLLYLKLALFVAIGLLSIKPTQNFLRWRKQLAAGGGLPSADEVARTRRWVMIEAHVLILIPLAAVLLARGVGVR
jgi:putative membrane protein